MNLSTETKLMVLLDIDHGCLGVYSSIEALSKAVDYQVEIDKTCTLYYQCWILDYSPEPTEWSWCYIGTDPVIHWNRVDPTGLGLDVNTLPPKELFKTNLVNSKWWKGELDH